MNCDLCGKSPAQKVLLQSASSRIIWWNHSKLNIELCAFCAERAYIAQQSRTLIQGWWGPLSALATIWFAVMNRFRIGTHRKQVPYAEIDGQKIPRPQLQLRKNRAVVATTVVAILIIFAIGGNYLNRPPRISDNAPSTYVGTCWEQKESNQLAQVNCDVEGAAYIVENVVDDPSMCIDTYISAGSSYACLKYRF